MTLTELTNVLRQVRDKDMTVDNARHYILVHTEEAVMAAERAQLAVLPEDGAEGACHSA
jgi:hypothetical protein